MFYANYWDIVQASVAFSLLAVEISIPIAIDLANEVCDQLAMVCETQLEFEGLQLADLIELMECELTVFARQRGSATFKYRIESISAKAAIDLLNMHGRFQRLIEIGDGSGCDSPEVSSLVHRRNDRTLIPELLAQDVDIR